MDKKYNTQEELLAAFSNGAITHEQYKQLLDEITNNPKISEYTNLDELKRALAIGKITMQQYKSYLEELNSTDEVSEVKETPEKPEVKETPVTVDTVETPTTQEDNQETTTPYDPETLKLDLASGKITMQQYKSYLEELNSTDEVSEIKQTPEKSEVEDTPVEPEVKEIPVEVKTPETTTQDTPETLKQDLASGKITIQEYRNALEKLNPTNPNPPIQEQPDTVVTPTPTKTVEAPYTKPDIPHKQTNKKNNKKLILIIIALIVTLTSIILGAFYITNYTGFTTVDVSEIYVTGYTTDGFKATPQVIFIPDHYKGNDITMYQDELEALSEIYNVDTSTVTAPSYDQTINDKLGLIGLEYTLSSEQPIAEGQETQINISYDEKLAKEQKIKLTGIELEASEYLVSPTGLYTQATVDKVDPEMLLASSIFEDELIDKAFYNPSNYTSKEVLHVSSWIKQDSISNEEFLENPEDAGMDVVGFYETKGKRSGDLELQYCIITMPGLFYSPEGLVQPYGYSDDDDTTIEHTSQCTDWETRGLTGWPKYLKDEGYEQIGGALN